MRWEGYRSVLVKKIVLPGDIAARQKQPHVIELAASIRKLGQEPVHAPTVDGRTHKLIAGRDRMAAILLLKQKAVWCHVAGDVTEQDALDLEVEENLHRRQDNRDELIARRVKKVAAEVEAKRPAAGDRKPGRPRTAEGEAREVVARELGTTSEAVRAAQGRAEVELPDKMSANPPGPVVETYGLPLVTPSESAELAAIQSALSQADTYLRRAVSALAPLAPLVLGGPLHARLLRTLQDAGAELRAARPVAVCPFCKRLPDRVVTCGACMRVGFVAEDILVDIADELKLGGDRAVVPDRLGGFISYAKAAAPKAKAPAKKIRIEHVDAAGKTVEATAKNVADDEDIPF